MEFELLDTGVFDEDRYFDIVVEYAKAGPDDICIRIEAFNRGPQAPRAARAAASVVPQHVGLGHGTRAAAGHHRRTVGPGFQSLTADDSNADPLPNLMFEYRLGPRHLYAAAGGQPLFTNNETNPSGCYGSPNVTPYVKDAFHRYVVNGEQAAINPDGFGTKAAFHFTATVAGEGLRRCGTCG